MLSSILPEAFGQFVADDAIVLELLQRGSPRASSVIVPWAVVMLDDPAISISKLAQLISLDSRLASRAIGFANEPSSVMSNISTTVDEALMRVGLLNARGFVLAETLPYLNAQAADSVPRERDEQAWKLAIMRAVISREIVRSSRTANADEAYTCALITSGVSRQCSLLPQLLLDRIEAAGLELHSAVSVVMGSLDGWPDDWIQAAIEQGRVGEEEEKSKLGQIISLADVCAPILMDETPFRFEAHPLVALEAKPLELSENLIQRTLSSSREIVRNYFKRFGL